MSAALELQAAYAAATNGCDIDAIDALTEADAVIWHNFDDREVPASSSGRSLRRLHESVRNLRWADVAVVATETGFVWQAVISGVASGGPIRVPTCMVVTLSEAGRIARVDEYLDPAGFAAVSA